MTQAEALKYIYEKFESLGIGPVFQDRRPLDDTTVTRNVRTYIVFSFEDGMLDEGPWYYGICTAVVGCRDIKRFTAAMNVLSDATSKFLEMFDYNDDIHGISMINVDQDTPVESDEDGNHECVFVFDVFVQK